MWLPVTLLLFVGVNVDCILNQHAWETENEYQYAVHTQALVGLDKLYDDYTGILLRGNLIIQVKSPETLLANFSNPQYAHIRDTLLSDPDTNLLDKTNLEFRQMPMSGKPMIIKLKHGLIRDLMIDHDVPTWELNICKAFISQLQIDTQGENAIKSKSDQIPNDKSPYAMFRAMEDSVGGKCEVLYDIRPLPDDYIENPIELPLPLLRGNGNHYEVKKVKNYEKCRQRQMYHYRVHDPLTRKGTDERNRDLLQLSSTQTFISGDLKRYTIQSTLMKNHISIKSPTSDSLLGNVHSITRLTLIKKSKISDYTLDSPELTNLESTGNLVYTYSNPFSNVENRRVRQPSISRNSAQVESLERSSSQAQDDNESTFSSSSSSKEYHKQDDSLLQPKSALHLAPNAPLLPYYVGYRGRSIQMSDKIDIVKQAENLISQIADELQSPYKSMITLEKYIILKNLVRTMSRKQYSELEDYILRYKDEPDRYNEMLNILRDVVTQAGTGPALLTIEDWIRNKKFEGIEAARLVSKLPKKARLPDAEYIRTLFEITSSRHVVQQKYLNVSAPLALAELIYNNHAGQKYYPIHSFGRITLEETRDKEITDRYIPYLADQLQQGFLENNANKIHTYILALGMTGHEKILSVFEPYLEGMEPHLKGTEPTYPSKFYRLLIVASLSTLARSQPKLVGPILFKLYSNLNEAQEVRALAVQQYIMTNPSMIALQTVARRTNIDSSEQVNSAVKTTLESIANTKRPELRNLAIKARNVRYLLNPKKYDSWKNSRGFYQDLEGVLKGLNLQYIVGDDGRPMYARLSISTLYDFLKLPSLEVGYAVSNYKQLHDQLKPWEESEEEIEKSKQKLNVENIAQTLNIKPEQLNKLEGNIFINSMYGLMFWSFDSQAIKRASNNLKDLLDKDHKIATTVFNNFETTLSFPTENGLPFMFTLDEPIVTKLKAEWNKNESPVTKRSGILNMYVANKSRKQFAILVPFIHRYYIAAIDDNQMLQSMPLEYEFEMDTRYLNLKIHPQTLPQPKLNSPLKLLHRSTVPYITQRDVFDFQPIALDKNILIKRDKNYKTMIERETYSVQLEADSKGIGQLEQNVKDVDQLFAKFQELQKLMEGRYKKLEILMNSEQLTKNELYFNLVHDKMAISALNDDNKQLSHESESLTMLPIKSSKLSSENRRKEIMKGLSKGLKSGKVHVYDMNFDFPKTLQKRRQLLTIGYVNSNTDRKSRTYLYWNSQKSEEERPIYEVCYFQQMQTSPNVPLNYEYMIKNAPYNRLKAELRYGESCETGSKVVIDMNMTRSNQLKEMLENSIIAKKCQEEIKKGNKALRACQSTTEIAEVRDQLSILIQPSNDTPKNLREIINMFIDLFSYIYPQADVKEDSETNAFTIKTTMYRSCSNVMQNLLMRIPRLNAFTKLNVNLPRPLETQILETQQQLKDSLHQNQEKKSSCTLDKNRVVTFDKRLYPVTLGACKHVLLTTYPRQDPDNFNHKTIPKEMRVTVLAEDADSASLPSRIITLLLGNQEVQLIKLDNLKARVDGKTIELPQSGSYQLLQSDESVFEIGILPDQSIEVTSYKYGISVVYDGERVQLSPSDRYRNAIRGLCGNYDFNPNNDFLTPKNCILTKPEEFAATYALTEENCKGPALKNKEKAEQAECRELPSERRRLTNVISDREAGRTSAESKNWGYHHDNLKKERGQNRNLYFGDVREYSQEQENRLDNNDSKRRSVVYRTKVFEQDEEICFSNRPVPTCPPNGRPAERKQKTYEFYCAPRNEETLAMKRLIEQGANPDLTRKPSSRSRVFDVPLSCNAA